MIEKYRVFNTYCNDSYSVLKAQRALNFMCKEFPVSIAHQRSRIGVAKCSFETQSLTLDLLDLAPTLTVDWSSVLVHQNIMPVV